MNKIKKKMNKIKAKIITKDEKAITLVALIFTTIILLLLAGSGIYMLTQAGVIEKAKLSRYKYNNSEKIENKTLKEYEEKVSSYISGATRDNGDFESKDIEDFSPTIKEENGTYIYAIVENIKINNENKIGAYIWILNGKVVGGSTENKFIYNDLEYNNKYSIQVMAVDENGKIKTSKEEQGNTKDKTYLYSNGKVYEIITGGMSHINRNNYGGCTATFNSDNIYVDAYSNGGGGGIITNKTIDLTEFKTIKAKGELTEYAYNDCKGRILSVSTSNLWGGTWYPLNSKIYSNSYLEKGNIVLEDDISSLKGEYYIINGFNQSRGYINEIWLEK